MTSTAPIRIKFVAHVRGGLRTVEGWLPCPDAEVVAHTQIGAPDAPPSQTWEVSHRRTGRRLGVIFPAGRDDALAIAAALADLPELKAIEVEAVEDGPLNFGIDRQAQCRAAIGKRLGGYAGGRVAAAEEGTVAP
jgi:hypothetical protein